MKPSWRENLTPYRPVKPSTKPSKMKKHILVGRIVNARLSGMSQRQIAENFDLSVSYVNHMIQEAMTKEFPEESRGQLWKINMHRLETQIADLQAILVSDPDDIKARQLLITTIEKQSKLAGLNKPEAKEEEAEKSEVSMSATELDELARKYFGEILDTSGAEKSVSDIAPPRVEISENTRQKLEDTYGPEELEWLDNQDE